MIDVARYFSIQLFFIILRETLETAIIISVLLSFIDKRDVPGDSAHAEHVRQINRGLRLQVWLGALCGLVICTLIGLFFIACFYFIETDLWLYTERIWEGVFSLFSSVIITVMGVGLLRINKVMKIKWWIKLGDAYQGQASKDMTLEADDGASGSSEQAETDVLSPLLSAGTSTSHDGLLRRGRRLKFSARYFLAILPFVTTLREGLEAVVFVGGIGMSQPLSSLPLAVGGGLAAGAGIGYSLYRGGNKMSLQFFLICLTCFLYVVSAGLMSRGVWFLELEQYVRRCGGLDVLETGSGPGLYDVRTAVWHVNCCNGLRDGWWMVANAIVGWTNTATYGSVASYILYWLAVLAWLHLRRYEERHGYLPVVPIKWQLKRLRKKIRLYEARRAQLHGTTDDRAAEAEVSE